MYNCIVIELCWGLYEYFWFLPWKIAANNCFFTTSDLPSIKKLTAKSPFLNGCLEDISRFRNQSGWRNLPGRFPHLKRYQSWKLYCWHSTHLCVLGLHPEGIQRNFQCYHQFFGRIFVEVSWILTFWWRSYFWGCFLKFYHWSGCLQEMLELHGPEILRRDINSEAWSGLVLAMVYGQAGPVQSLQNWRKS